MALLRPLCIPNIVVYVTSIGVCGLNISILTFYHTHKAKQMSPPSSFVIKRIVASNMLELM